MSCALEDNPLSGKRMESFVNSGDGAMMAGNRRTGQIRLMEDLQKHLEENFPETAVFTVRKGNDTENILPEVLPDGSVVLIHYISDVPDWERLVRERAEGTVTVYCGQELCHQVPVCFKNIVTVDGRC